MKKIFIFIIIVMSLLPCMADCKKVAVMGTSLSVDKEGSWSNWLRRNGYNVANFANDGEDSRHGLNKLRAIADFCPDVVFIEYSVNDAYTYRGISQRESTENLNKIISEILKSNADCRVIIMTMNPAHGEYARLRPQLSDYYRRYRDYSYSRKVKLIDFNRAWVDLFNRHPELESRYIPDGLHPNTEGTIVVILPILRMHHSIVKRVNERKIGSEL